MFLTKASVALAIVMIICPACLETGPTPLTPTRQITPVQKSISFQVVQQAAPLGDHPKEAYYSVITSASDLEALITRLPGSAIEEIKAAQASDHALYLLAFAGVRGSSGYGLNITSIDQQGNQFTVVVAETKPAPESIVEPAMTLPYVIAAVPASELPQGERLFFIFTNPQGTTLGQGEAQIP